MRLGNRALQIALIPILLAAGGARADEFRRWGGGWHDNLSLRYRLPSGWSFTLATDLELWDSDERDDGVGFYDPDIEELGLVYSDSRERFFRVDVARLFPLGHNLHLGPAIGLWHYYSRDESDTQWVERSPDGTVIELRTRSGFTRHESFGAAFELVPLWQVHSRVSIESRFGIQLYHYHRREENDRYRETAAGVDYDFTDTYVRSGDLFESSSFYPSLDMTVGLFFYF